MREGSTPAASSASRCGASVCDPSALDTLTYPMSIITPPEKISTTLQCVGGFRNGFSDLQGAPSRQKLLPPENRSFSLRSRAHWDSRFSVPNSQFREKQSGTHFGKTAPALPSSVPFCRPSSRPSFHFGKADRFESGSLHGLSKAFSLLLKSPGRTYAALSFSP